MESNILDVLHYAVSSLYEQIGKPVKGGTLRLFLKQRGKSDEEIKQIFYVALISGVFDAVPKSAVVKLTGWRKWLNYCTR